VEARRRAVPARLAEEWRPLLALAGLAALLFRDVLFGGRVLFERDIHAMWLPQMETLVRCVASGAWPVWDPYVGFGQPLWANPNNQVLYPFTWLNLLFVPFDVYTALAVSHTFWGAVGVHLLARSLGLSRTGSFAGGASWMLGGPVVSAVNLWNHMTAAAWLPWSVLAADRACRGGSRAAVVGWGLALAAQVLAGSPDVLVMSVLASAAWVLVVCRETALTRRLALAALAGVLALALSAAQWWPSLDVAARTARADLPASARTAWGVHPVSLAQIPVPARLYQLPLDPADRTALFEGRDPLFHSIYLGLAGLALVAAGAHAARPPLRLFLALLAGAALLVALGRHTPFVDSVAALVPPLRMLRYPAKAMLCVSFAWALLVAFGLDACRSGGAMPRRARWVLAGASLGLLLVAGHALAWPEAWRATLLDAAALPQTAASGLAAEARRIAGAAALAFAATVVASRAGTRRGRLLAAAVAADLLLAHHDLNATAPRALLETPPETARAAAAGPLSRVYSWDYRAFVPGREYRREAGRELFTEPDPSLPREPELAAALRMQAVLEPQTQARWGLRGSFDRDIVLLQSPHSQTLMRLVRLSEETPAALRLLQIASVDSVVALHTAGLESLRPVAELPGRLSRSIRVLRVPGALPPFYTVGRARVADDATAASLLLSDAFDPAREVLLAAGEPGGTPGPLGAARLLDARPDCLVVEADLARDGWLVTVEGHDAGWRAAVDGRPAPVVRANLAFRAVRVPAGRHVVEQRYAPPSIAHGLLLSGAGLLAALGFALAGGRRPPS
jgi:hypothetical protein